MKLSWIAETICGLPNPRQATEQQVADALERMATRANIAGEGQRLDLGTGNMYSSPRLGRNAATDVSRETAPYVVKAVRAGHWQIYERQPDGSYRKYGPESIGLDALQAQADKLNAKVRAKSSKANEETIRVLVNEEMQRTGTDYTKAFCNLKTRRPELFWTMKESGAEIERQRTAKARRQSHGKTKSQPRLHPSLRDWQRSYDKDYQ